MKLAEERTFERIERCRNVSKHLVNLEKLMCEGDVSIFAASGLQGGETRRMNDRPLLLVIKA